jgi:hypothetical protein
MKRTAWMNFKRAMRFWWQRGTRGWDDSETWNLETRLAEHILPRIKRLKELTIAYPDDLQSFEDWQGILDEMIFAFEYHSKDQMDKMDITEEDYRRVENGLMLFAKHYNNLGW